MAAEWLYTHDGQTHGPFSTDEIRHRAAAGLLRPDDLLWPANTDPQRAVTAGVALDFAGLVREPTAAPDWLADVRRMEQAAGQRQPRATAPTPEWLEDVRRLSEEAESRKRGRCQRLLSFMIRNVRRLFPARSKESPT